MKNVPMFGKNGTPVDAYQDADIEEIRPLLAEAKHLWDQEWRDRGSKDEGTMCLGKGLQFWYLKKRGRYAEPRTIIRSPDCQGNISAAESRYPAMELLSDAGVEMSYYDGWMD